MKGRGETRKERGNGGRGEGGRKEGEGEGGGGEREKDFLDHSSVKENILLTFLPN